MNVSRSIGAADRREPVHTRAAETKREILAAAVELFSARGYDGVSIDEVTHKAGVTKGAFYHHFPNKQSLLRDIHDEFVDHYLAVIDDVLTQSLPSRDKLALLLEEILVAVSEFTDEIAIFLEQRRYLSGEMFAEIRSKRDKVEEKFESLLVVGQQEGNFRELPSTHIAALGIIGMCASAYQWYRPGPLSPREIGRMYADMVLNGLAPDARVSPKATGDRGDPNAEAVVLNEE